MKICMDVCPSTNIIKYSKSEQFSWSQAQGKHVHILKLNTDVRATGLLVLQCMHYMYLV